jgi:hypothetical protein
MKVVICRRMSKLSFWGQHLLVMRDGARQAHGTHPQRDPIHSAAKDGRTPHARAFALCRGIFFKSCQDSIGTLY